LSDDSRVHPRVGTVLSLLKWWFLRNLRLSL
jgi:hypothetical protein